MITTINLINIQTTHSFTVFLVTTTFKIYSLSNFQIYHGMLLTVVIMLYITSSGLIYLITGSLYLLTIFTHFTYPPTNPHLWQPPICSLPMSLVFLDPHISKTICLCIVKYLCLSDLFHLA